MIQFDVPIPCKHAGCIKACKPARRWCKDHCKTFRQEKIEAMLESGAPIQVHQCNHDGCTKLREPERRWCKDHCKTFRQQKINAMRLRIKQLKQKKRDQNRRNRSEMIHYFLGMEKTKPDHYDETIVKMQKEAGPRPYSLVLPDGSVLPPGHNFDVFSSDSESSSDSGSSSDSESSSDSD